MSDERTIEIIQKEFNNLAYQFGCASVQIDDHRAEIDKLNDKKDEIKQKIATLKHEAAALSVTDNNGGSGGLKNEA